MRTIIVRNGGQWGNHAITVRNGEGEAFRAITVRNGIYGGGFVRLRGGTEGGWGTIRLWCGTEAGGGVCDYGAERRTVVVGTIMVRNGAEWLEVPHFFGHENSHTPVNKG